MPQEEKTQPRRQRSSYWHRQRVFGGHDRRDQSHRISVVYRQQLKFEASVFTLASALTCCGSELPLKRHPPALHCRRRHVSTGGVPSGRRSCGLRRSHMLPFRPLRATRWFTFGASPQCMQKPAGAAKFGEDLVLAHSTCNAREARHLAQLRSRRSWPRGCRRRSGLRRLAVARPHVRR